MKFSVEPKIFEKFPGVEIGVLVITGMDNRGHNEEILKLLRGEEKHQKDILTGVELGSLPEISTWRKIYQAFGSDPKDYSSSIEALLRRARGGIKPLPQINNLVDLYNYISLKYHLPAGAEDLDKVAGNIELSFASGSERGKYIGGEIEDTCYQGEVIYKDAAGFICRRWNWREADRTKIDFDTVNSVLVIEKATGVDNQKFQEALKETGRLIQEFLKGKVQTFVLSQNTNFFDIPFQTQSKMEKPAVQTVPIKEETITKHIKPSLQSYSALTSIMKEDENSLAYKIRLIIFRILKEVIGKGKARLEDVKIEHPSIENYGDYTTNIALIMAGKLKMKPRELAEKIVSGLNEYIRKHQSTSSVDYSNVIQDSHISDSKAQKVSESILEKAEVAGPGFVNLWLSSRYLSSELVELLKGESSARTSYFRGRKIMIEFAHPNTHKELHIGHMRTLVTGEALSRILSTTGAEMFRANYQGDIGPHVAKAIFGTEWILAEKRISWDQADKLSLAEKAHLLGQGYVVGNKCYGEKKAEIDEINIKLYQKDSSIWPVYERTRKWSMDYYDEFYKRFYSRFDKLYFESEVADCGKEIVLKNIGKVFEESDGAVVFPGKKYGLHTRVFVTKDGNPTYEGKDMCLAPRQFADFPFEKCIHIVANEQAGYFQVIIKALELIDPKFIGREYHLSMGMVNLVGRKISSRTGEVLTVDKLLEDVKELLKELIKEGALTKDEKADVLEKTTIGAVKYSVLKTGPQLNVAFDLEKSVSLEGDSGPYLMYTYARCKSVLCKAKDLNSKLKIQKSQPKTDQPQAEKPQLKTQNLGSGKDTWKVALDDSFQVEEAVKHLNPEELSLLRTFYRFPEVVTEAARTLSPNLICSFLFDLAQKYNLFYNKHSILNLTVRHSGKSRPEVGTHPESVGDPGQARMTSSFRLALTSATAKSLKQGLHILGIETVERM